MSCEKCSGGIIERPDGTYEFCSCRREERRKEILNRILKEIPSGIFPIPYSGSSEVSRRLKILSENPLTFCSVPVIFIGPHFSQKTTQMVTLMHTLAENHLLRSRYLVFGEFVNSLIKCYQSGEGFSRFLDTSVDAYFIDHFFEPFQVVHYQPSYYTPFLDQFFRKISGKLIVLSALRTDKIDSLSYIPSGTFTHRIIELSFSRKSFIEMTDQIKPKPIDIWLSAEGDRL